MSDVLLSLSQNPLTRKLVSGVKLPIPMPEVLARMTGAATERFLEGKTVFVSGRGGVSEVLARTLSRAGATTEVDSDTLRAAFAAAAEAYGRPVHRIAPPPVVFDPEQKPSKVHALIVDATGATTPQDLKSVYNFLHAQLPRVGKSGRVVILGRPWGPTSTFEHAATAQALEGLTRSLAKEIGGRGATANLIVV